MRSKVKLRLHIKNTVHTATLFVIKYVETFLFTDTSYGLFFNKVHHVGGTINTVFVHFMAESPKKDNDARHTCTTQKYLIYVTKIYEF
jgi:hypothetical protein